MITKNDYKEIADAIIAEELTDYSEMFARVLAYTNPLFDENKFIEYIKKDDFERRNI